MDTSIVCGIDGSRDSDSALVVAVRVADRLGARLVLAHVAEPVRTPHADAVPYGGVSMAGPFAADQTAALESGARLLEQAAEAAGVVDAEQRVEIGHPAQGLAEIANDEEAELIVVGSRGRGALKAALLGSVSNSLVGLARCPVLVVTPGAAAS